jgi:hypothetical protein
MTRESIRLEGLPVQESVQYQEPKFTQEGLETVILKGDATYPLTITQSFGPEIVNPDVNVATALAYGVIQPTRKSDAPYAMLVGLQANGRCGADCKGCVFANHRVGEAMNDSNRTKKLARPVDPQTMSEVIAIGKQLISLEGDQTFRLNALLSGDPAYSPYVPALIDMVMRDPTFSASRLLSARHEVTCMLPVVTFLEEMLLLSQKMLMHKSSVTISISGDLLILLFAFQLSEMLLEK